MPTYTAQEIIDRASDAADMHDNFVTPTTWLRWLSQERYALELFCARSGWPLDFETATITVDGTEDGAFLFTHVVMAETVPLDTLAIVAVHAVESNGLRLLKYTDAVSFLRQLPNSPVHNGEARFYRCRRNGDGITLNFYPNPEVGDQFLVTYIPSPEPTDSVADTISYPMGWEERIVLGMARRALDKEESDSEPIQKQMAEMDQQIEELCWNKVMSESPSVRNVDQPANSLPTKEHWAWV